MNYQQIVDDLYVYFLTEEKEFLKLPMQYFKMKLKEKYFSVMQRKYVRLDTRRKIVKSIGRERFRNDIEKLEDEFLEKLDMCKLIFKSTLINPKMLLDEFFYFVTENRYLHQKEIKGRGKKAFPFKNVMVEGKIKKIKERRK